LERQRKTAKISIVEIKTTDNFTVIGVIDRGDREGLERSLRNKTVAALRRRGVLNVQRAQ
jgi:hypothetical protein